MLACQYGICRVVREEGETGWPSGNDSNSGLSEEQFGCAEAYGPGPRIPLRERLCPGGNDEGFRDSPPDQSDREAFVAASLDRLSKEIRNLHTTQQALFAAVDSLTRLFLTCIPEPPPEALDQAKRKARLRYERYLVSVAQNMTSDSRATLTELVDRG